MINSTIDNFSSEKFQANDILFHKVIDTKSNNVLGYKNSDASNNFNYVLSNNNSGQINFFTLSILDQDLNFIEDIDDYFLHLQFIKMKKQNTDALLMKIVEYGAPNCISFSRRMEYCRGKAYAISIMKTNLNKKQNPFINLIEEYVFNRDNFRIILNIL
jgi:hypothetical protein